MNRRSIVGALGLALVLILLPATLAGADFRGTDMWTNLVPGAGADDTIPLSYFSLDYHVDGPGITSSGDVPALVGQFLASLLFTIATFFMRVTILAFDWAFNVDIIGGRHGTLAPVGQATQHLWFSTFKPLMVTGVLLLGGWFAYKVLARRFGEAGAGLIRAICLAGAAMAIIFNPGSTIGAASSITNDLAGGIVSATTGGNGGQDVSNRLRDTFIYQPWVVLEFGGLRHCVDWSRKDADGFPKQARQSTPASARDCRDHLRSHDGRGGYAQRFLRYPGGSKARDREYEALVKGEVPDDSPSPTSCPRGDCSLVNDDSVDPHQFDGYRIDKADAPAADMMQAQGAVQRLAFVVLLTLGIISAILLLGLICFASLFVQLGLMVLLSAAPVMVLMAIFPGAHGVFFTWAKWIGKFLVAKVAYAVVLSGALGLSAALMSAGAVIGYLFVFALQAALFLGLFIKRKLLAEQLTSRREYFKSENSAKTFVAGAASAAVGAVAAPVAAAGAAGAAGKSRLAAVQQQHAKSPNTQDTKSGESSSGGKSTPDSTSPPATAGREYSPALDSSGRDQASTRDSSTTVATINHDKPTPDVQTRGEDPVPAKSFREDYEKAKAERAQDKPPAPVPAPYAAKPLNGAGRPEPFSQALEQERAKTPNT